MSAERAPSRGLIAFMALACGLTVANLYYAQPLAGPISQALGMGRAATGLIVTLTQIGYGLGLVFLAPLGDLVENRRLIMITALCGSAAMALAGVSPSAGPFLGAMFLVGLGSVAAQMLVPVAAHLAPAEARGRVVGDVMSGLITGILLSRPLASVLADHFGWRAVFFVSSGAMLVLTAAMVRILPHRDPDADHSYGELIGSMKTLLLETPILRRRAFYQGCMFGAFSLFWTTAPLILASPVYHLNQTQIALFALAGATGALIAPVAGRMADRGWTRPATGVAFLAAALCFVLCWIGRGGGLGLWALVGAGLLLDLGVQTSQVLGQREIYSLAAHARSRLNGIYVALFFIGGAIGSGVGGALYAWTGWGGVVALGLLFCALAFGLYVTEFTGRSPQPATDAA
jgi:predicted MFS family arabinose efflux permease